MKKLATTISLLLLLTSLALADAAKVRQPGVAGAFYPGDRTALTSMIDGFLQRAAADSPAPSEAPLAIVAPHAGYQYSGPVAAYSYFMLKGRKYTRVIVIAPSHFDAFSFVSAYDGDIYRTPLGDIPLDKEFIAKLARATPVVKISPRGHLPSAQGTEHALEVQLPFLQRALGDFKLVPLVMGRQDFETEHALGLALGKLIHDDATLIVASSDLSHYHPQQVATRMDRKMLDALEHWDYRAMAANFQAQTWEACGGGPIIATMIAAERLGANRARVLKYATSADTAGDTSRVVGYSAVAFTRSARQSAKEAAFTLTPDEKAELLRISREAVRLAVKEQRLYEPPLPASEALRQERGAFVTLRKKGDLRGCIGHTVPQQPLYLTVRDVAVLAALRDPRFPPVTSAEFESLEFEVSVLSPFRRVQDAREVRVGEHGVLVRRAGREALLLPQVAVEERWDRNTLLSQCSLKAGLDAGSWRQSDAEIFVFTALVFDERDQKKPPAAAAPAR